jgi:hypothetical protein
MSCAHASPDENSIERTPDLLDTRARHPVRLAIPETSRIGSNIAEESSMRLFHLTAMTVSLVSALSTPSSASETTRWKTIIGVVQAGNIVDGIAAGGQPWSALDGEARVDLASGEIEFEVRGLVLAGGNSIGTPDGVKQVAGTIACAVGATVSTPLVPLTAQGNASFSGKVAVPLGCASADVAFLVTTPPTGSPPAPKWIANGAVRTP